MVAPDFIAPLVAKPVVGDVLVADFTSFAVENGDILVLGIRSQGTAPGEVSQIPAGWFRGGLEGTLPVGDRVLGVFYHVVTDKTAETFSYTFTGVSGGTSSRVISIVGVVRGGDLAFVNDGGLKYRSDAFIPGHNAGAVPFLEIAIWGAEFTAGVSVLPNAVPAGLTTQLIAQTAGGATPAIVDNSVTAGGTRTGLVVTSRKVEAGGVVAVPDMTMGWPGAPTSIKSASMIIRGKTAAQTAGIPIKKGDGSSAFLTVGNDRRTPTRVALWLPGFVDVETFINKLGGTASHRGGSLTKPEYSERAYDASVFKHFGALEFSCAFSGDATPVLFGNGDQYLDRMAGVTGNIDPTTLPWVTINSTYRNVLRPEGPGITQPLYRLEQFLEKYTPNHVVLVDPKFGWNSPARVNAMLDLCRAIGGPEKIIIKFDSPTISDALVDAAQAGPNPFKTMNYWGTEIEKLTPEYGTDKWDLIGIRYDADQTMYDTAQGIGKPIWAAVIPDQAGYNLAASRGADLMMCADINNIAAVI